MEAVQGSLWFGVFALPWFWIAVAMTIAFCFELFAASNDSFAAMTLVTVVALVFLHLTGAVDVGHFLYFHWGWLLVGLGISLVCGAVWMTLKYIWWLRERGRDIDQSYSDAASKKKELDKLQPQFHLDLLATWLVYWLFSMISTLGANWWEGIKFFILEVLGRQLKLLWKREVDRILNRPHNES